MMNIFYWIKELAYSVFVIFILNTIGVFYCPRTGSFSKEKINIVLVHGILTTSIMLAPWRKKLERMGFNVVFFEYGFGLGDISKNAKKLHDFLAKNQLGECVLVGHSLGGLIILEAKRLYSDVVYIPTVTICSPVRGSSLYWMMPTTAGRQFNPKGEFVKRIAEFSPRYQNTLFVKVSFDGVVFDGYSCFPEHECVVLDYKGHNAMVFEISGEVLNGLVDKVRGK